MRVSHEGVSLWYGTPDAPAPSGVVAAGGDTTVTIGLQPPDHNASITILFRINHGAPRTIAAHPTHQDHGGKQYFQAELSGFKTGDKVEYVAIYRSGKRQIPSNHEAETHVATFTLGPHLESHSGANPHHDPEAENLKEALRAVLRAAGVFHGGGSEDSFITLYFNHGGHAEAFWKELETHSDLKPHIGQLQFAIQIDLLTAGHLPLIEALVKRPGLKSMRDLARLDESVWHGLIAKSGVPQHAQVFGLPHEAQAQFYAASIISSLDAAFPTMAVWRIVANSHHVDPLAAKFLENSPDFDIRTTRVDAYCDQRPDTAFKGIPEARRAGTIKEVKRIQRLFAASTNSHVFRELLGTGLDSAHAIAVIPRSMFIARYGHLLGGHSQAAQTHERAQFINARNIHLRTSIHDAIQTPPTRGLGHHSQAAMINTYARHTSVHCPPCDGHKQTSQIAGRQQATHLAPNTGSLHEDLVKRFPNSEELFGTVSLCNCSECESAIGPAAYLVDVFDFLGASKPNSHHVTPLDVLIGNPQKGILGRRPDLAYLNLTCANTNTTLPYIDIVNEVLESYVALGLKLEGSSAHDSANATSAELDANPQYVNYRAYEILDQAVYPFTLPFNRPLLVTRSYLEQLGTSRFEVLKTFNKDHVSPTVRNLLSSEFLGIGAEEFQILTGNHFDPKEKATLRPDDEYYGYRGASVEHADHSHRGSWTHELSNVATFQQRTGISHAELRALVSTRFVSPYQPVGTAKELLQRIPVSHSTLSELLKSNLAHPAAALVTIELSGISAHELKVLTGAMFDHVRNMVVIDDPIGSCDPAAMKLQHFDGSTLDGHTLGRMHRFIRLYRKTGWTIVELDRTISALGAAEITPEVLIHLAHVKQLQARFHITNLQVLLALWAPVETHGANSLYYGLFLNKATHHQGVDPAFEQQSLDGQFLADPAQMLVDHLPVLQSAFRVTALDLQLILDDCGLDAAKSNLDLKNVSEIYRRAALSKALKLKTKDFLSLKTLSGLNPFASPEATMHFASLAAEIAGSGLTFAQASYVLRHVTLGNGKGETEPLDAIVFDLARNLRDGLTSIVRDNAIIPDPTGIVTAQKLALLYDSSVVDELTAIVNGTVNYSAPLIVLPPNAVIPAQLLKKLTFDPIAQMLICKSPLTLADRATLFSLSDDPVFQAAVDAVYQAPINTIKTVMYSFLDPVEAPKRLVTENASLGQDLKPIQLDSSGQITGDPTKAQTTVIASKYAYILQGLLPFLISHLGASLMKRTISDSLKISGSTSQKLVEVLLKSRRDHTKPAAFDLHALQTMGLSCDYYKSPDLTGEKASDIARIVAFAGPKNNLPQGTMSASWKGMIAPPTAGDFEFILRTNGIPTLWVNDLLAPLELVNVPGTPEWISRKITLKACQLYQLRLDVIQLPVASATMTLMWQSMTVRKSIVPDVCLFPATIISAFRETYILLHKASLIANGIKLSDDELVFLAKPDRELPILDLNHYPVGRNESSSKSIDELAPGRFAALIRAARLVSFRRDLAVGDVKLTQLFAASHLDHAINLLVATTGWDDGLVRALVGPTGFDLKQADFVNEHWLLRLKECVRMSDRLGVSPTYLFRWSMISSDFSTLERIGQEVKKCVQGQYDAATWLTIAKPLNDKLRGAQRNALVAYLLPRMGLKDSDQLFEYFLIDAQMGTCTETSRISLAHSSVQLFVQRCLMNLEDAGDNLSVSPHQIDSDQWEKWRKHYRVWQANCQVLLHPENWMEQGLRDDKTPFFKALESDLTQQEITADNVETAYLNYLEKLQQVARLETIGTFWQDRDPDSGEEVHILHVFARTFHAPHTYFYRTLVNFTTWTPWEEMQVTIEGDHVMPLIWNRRLYVFWPTFLKKTIPPETPNSIDATSKNIPVSHAKTYWQVSLAWTELKHNKWTAKQVSKHAFDIDPGYFVEDDPSRYAKAAYSFKTSIVNRRDGSPPSLLMQCVFHGPTVSVNHLRNLRWFFYFTVKETTEVVGAFELGGCNGESVEAFSGTMPWPDPLTPEGTDVEGLTYVLSPHKTGLTLTKSANQHSATFLHGSPTPYRLLYPHQFSEYLLQAPLFYQDKHRTFFVSPHEEHGPVHQMSSAVHAAFHRRHSVPSKSKPAQSHPAGHPHTNGKAEHHSSHHAAPSKPSEFLLELQRHLAHIGEDYAKHHSNRRSAWGHHALGHNTHPPSMTKLRFETFYHPFVCEFIKSITRQGINGLLNQTNQRLGTNTRDTFAHLYKPTDHVIHPLPMENVDLDHGPYAIYNQELFFHIPDLIHERLHQNQRYDDAIRWLKYIFDPTDDSHGEAPPDRYWKYLPLKRSPRDSIQQLLATMESGDETHSQLIADWAKNPFKPYAVARHRLEAYKKNIFIKFVRTHIDHGDALFRTDSKEAINEAQQHYILASHLLGPKPERIDPLTRPKPESYASLRGRVDTFAVGLALLENEYPFSGKVTGHPKADSGGMQNMGRTLYFSAPKNTKLYELWDIVEDRLYKIRNCLNFQGVFRQLALFDPPIDPALLVRAAAQGIDLGSVMSDVQSPLPAYRFSYMLQKALEMCNECRSFGGALLSALEKNDGEALSLLRSTQEAGILDLVHRVKVRQLDEANAQVDALNATRNTTSQRYAYYQALIGVSNSTAPALGTNIPLLPVPSKKPGDAGDGIQLLPEEKTELDLSTAASVVQGVAAGIQALATVMYVIPHISAHAQPVGVGATIAESGLQLGEAAKSGATVVSFAVDVLSASAAHSGKMGGYFRRQADWTLQSNLAACEIMQIDRQIAAATIRVEIAQHELDSHEKQIENAQTILDYMTNQKFTTKELYGWMVSDTSSSYFSCYQMAFALAKKAERAFRFERGLTDSNFIQFGYWDSMRKGLLAGDRLHLALLQMENAYTDQNLREYEISRDISLLLNSPLALIALKETGTCEISIPESFFDADYPGHYMRRLKNVSLTIPCVVGPYTSLNCRLMLLSNKTRISSSVGDQYAEDLEGGDDRFVNNFAAVQSIATSHGMNDTGLFEVNFRDERYLPFEGAGVISRWRLEMPKENNAFDFESVSDVIFHFKFTSREGGDPLRQAARQSLASGSQDDLVRLFSARHEFSADWYRFLNPANESVTSLTMSIDLSPARFPYQFRGKSISINQVELFLKFKEIHDAQNFSQDGTPLGDYAIAKPLTLSITPPGGNPVSRQLKSDKSLLNGLPHASADVSDQTAGPGTWTIDVKNEDLAKLPASLRTDGGANKIFRFKPDVIVDIAFVCHYSAS